MKKLLMAIVMSVLTYRFFGMFKLFSWKHYGLIGQHIIF